MKIIGVSGQIGAGKSLMANYLAKKGGVNLEADEIGHMLLDSEKIKCELVKCFGKGILDKNNSISRKKLGKIAFKSDANISKLNSVMHPAMVEEIRLIVHSEKQKGRPFIIINAALLFSMQLDKLCETIIFVEATPKVRLARLLEFRNMAKDKAEERLFAQDKLPKNNEKVIMISNNDTVDKLYKSVDIAFTEIMLTK